MANKKTELKQIDNQLQEIPWGKVYEKTPENYTKKRHGKAGMTFTYVETGYVIQTLNTLFGYLWDFEVVEEKILQKVLEVVVRGKLTVHVSPTITLVKTQYGGSAIKVDRDGKPLSIANDLKAAASDALKKCASLIGVASDIYWGGEANAEEEMEEVVKPVVSTIKPNFISDTQRRKIYALYKEKGLSNSSIKTLLKLKIGVDSHTELTTETAEKWIAFVSGIPSKKEEKSPAELLSGGIEG